jgi:hypothetical protein
MRRETREIGAASIGCFDLQFVDFSVRRTVRHDHRFAADWTVLDIRLLGHREIESQIDRLPTMRTGDVVTLDEDHAVPDEILIIFKVLDLNKVLAASLFT